MHTLFSRSALGAALASAWLAASAQSTGTLSEVTVTASPLGSDLRIAPAERLDGPGLLLRTQGSLGGTLDGTPGVAATQFGPNVSRPIIRGLDGDRIRILHNGGASLDASGLSFDHAVPADPIAVEAIEVLRGPAALLYGGSAVGGVVNLLDNRIPREPLDGVTGRVDASAATGSGEASGALMLEGGNGRYAVHVDASGRQSGDVRVPASPDCTRGGATTSSRRLCNTGSEARGGAVGATAFFDRGSLGASATTFRHDYGSAAEEEVRIGMQSDRYALEGRWRPAAGPLESLRAQAGHTDYRHTEFDAGEPGTVFRNRGNDLRVEARHRPLGAFTGLVGLQAEQSRFAADGEEAFAPHSHTRQRAVFAYEELATGFGRLSAGLRRESVRVASSGDPDPARFSAGERRFAPSSVALGALWNAAPDWQLTANLARTERAPRDYELFANGPHVATGAWEVGDPGLGKERSAHLDLGAQWKRGGHSAKVSAFVNRFSGFVSLEATGSQRADAGGDLLPEYAYRAVRARFQGLEASGNLRLRDQPAQLDLEWRGDLLRATNGSTGQPLPRIAPARVGATLVARLGDWGARLGFDATARQDLVPAGEQATPGYTIWHAALTRTIRVGEGDLLAYARLDNLTDQRARSATSILTQTAPGRAVLAGRSLRVGVRAQF